MSVVRCFSLLTTNIEDKDSPRILKIGNAAKPLAILIDRHAGWC